MYSAPFARAAAGRGAPRAAAALPPPPTRGRRRPTGASWPADGAAPGHTTHDPLGPESLPWRGSLSILSYPVLSCPTLSYSTLSCPVLS